MSAYKVEGYEGIAWRSLGPHEFQEWDDEYGEFVDAVDTETIRMVMVGDDRVHLIPHDAIVHIEDDEFCRECGQIGCGHG